MAEVDVILRLMEYGLDARWGNDPPDIEIHNLQVDVEVKRMSAADRLKNAKEGEVVELDDIQRMRAIIRRDVLKSVRDEHVFILVIMAENFGLDEFRDLFLDEGITADPKSKGLFCRPEYSSISAAVSMMEPFLWPVRRLVPPGRRSPSFIGVLNPKGEKEVPVALRNVFSIVRPEDFTY